MTFQRCRRRRPSVPTLATRLAVLGTGSCTEFCPTNLSVNSQKTISSCLKRPWLKLPLRDPLDARARMRCSSLGLLVGHFYAEGEFLIKPIASVITAITRMTAPA
jgi:hypothetical protein